MRIMLDTSAYSAFMRGVATAMDFVSAADEIGLSAIVLGELHAGFALGTRQAANEDELRSFMASRRVRVIAIDDDTAIYYAVIRNALRARGTPIPSNDVWIAASAMQYGMQVVTCDTHFEHVAQIISHQIS